MKKLHRGGSNPDGEPLSAGRVEYLEAARQRVRRRRLRRTVIILAALILVTLFATGAVGASIARVKDLVDTVHIALSPAVGWPQQTGLGELTAVQPMSGSFVAMDEDACAVYSLGGTRLASIQSGYARPALAAGKTALCCTTAPATSCGWKAAPRTCTAKRWKTASICAPCRTPARWPWPPIPPTAPPG